MSYNLEDSECQDMVIEVLEKEREERSNEDLKNLNKVLMNLPIMSKEAKEKMKRLEEFYELEQLSSISIEKFKRFETIYKKGQDASKFYIIIKGKVSFFDQELKHLIFSETPVMTFNKQGFFGQYNILYQMKNQYTAMAMQKDTYVMTFERKEFLKFFSFDFQNELESIQNLFECQHIFKKIKFDLMIKTISAMQKLHLKKNQVIYKENDKADDVYLVQQGEIEIYKYLDLYSVEGNQKKIKYSQCLMQQIKQGGLFGNQEIEQENFDRQLRQTSAQASNKGGMVYKMNKILYVKCLEQNEALNNKFFQALQGPKQRSSLSVRRSFLLSKTSRTGNQQQQDSGMDSSRSSNHSLAGQQLRLPKIPIAKHQQRRSFQDSPNKNATVNSNYWGQLIQNARESKKSLDPQQVKNLQIEKSKFQVNVIRCDSTDSEEKLQVVDENNNNRIEENNNVKQFKIKKSNLFLSGNNM